MPPVENTEIQENEEISQVKENENLEQPDDASVETPEPKAESESDTKPSADFTPEQKTKINELIRSRLERQKARMFRKYGVQSDKEFENLIGMQQSYSVMKERYEARNGELKTLNEKLAFIENNINPERYDDIRAYFKGKGIEFSSDTLKEALQTHPEWLQVMKSDNTPRTTFTTIGASHENGQHQETDSERMKRIFGI